MFVAASNTSNFNSIESPRLVLRNLKLNQAYQSMFFDNESDYKLH